MIGLGLVVQALAAAAFAGWTDAADYAERAAATPSLHPLLLPRPRGGTHEWTFALYGVDATHNFANITRGMKKFGVGNGCAPLRRLQAADCLDRSEPRHHPPDSRPAAWASPTHARCVRHATAEHMHAACSM